jgi:hypothetical protein
VINDHITKIGEALAFLRALGERYELIGCNGNSGYAVFFRIALVNYQP